MTDWQPIETAPKDGTPILACVAGREYLAEKVQWHPPAGAKGNWAYPCTAHGPALPLTHWTALPKPPEAA